MLISSNGKLNSYPLVISLLIIFSRFSVYSDKNFISSVLHKFRRCKLLSISIPFDPDVLEDTLSRRRRIVSNPFRSSRPAVSLERVVNPDEINPHGHQGSRRIRRRYEEIEQVFMILLRRRAWLHAARFTILFLSRRGVDPVTRRACNNGANGRRYSTRLALRPRFLRCVLLFPSPPCSSLSLSSSHPFSLARPFQTFSPRDRRGISAGRKIYVPAK